MKRFISNESMNFVVNVFLRVPLSALFQSNSKESIFAIAEPTHQHYNQKCAKNPMNSSTQYFSCVMKSWPFLKRYYIYLLSAQGATNLKKWVTFLGRVHVAQASILARNSIFSDFNGSQIQSSLSCKDV